MRILLFDDHDLFREGLKYLLPVMSRPDNGQTADNHGAMFMRLSRRQFEVLMKAVQGKSNKVIAKELDISDHTVEAHFSVAFRTLGVQNRT